MRKSIFIIAFLLPLLSFGQVMTIGTPKITNYAKSVYNASTQNWDIAQDQQGFMYFANNDGILRFDGVKWNLIRISNSSKVRSVFVDSKNNIYVGLENDFGIIEQEDFQRPLFKSLKYLLPKKYDEFDDIWRIYEIAEGIVYQSYDYLFVLKDNQVKTYQPQSSFHFSFKIDGSLYIQEPGIGVFEFLNGELNKLSVSGVLVDKNICAILKVDGDSILIGTEADGIFVFHDGEIRPWNTAANEMVIMNKLYCATLLPEGNIAFGTILNGLVISDKQGNIIQQLNTENGLQNNTILSSFVDNTGELWLGLDNGIDYIEINAPLSSIQSDKLGTGYCCHVFNDKLYMGTNQGLYVMPLNSSASQSFELVKNSAGQVWSLEEFNGELICGHNLGTFRIEGNNATKIGNEPGAWKYIKLKNSPNLLIGGHYNGLVLLKRENNRWNFFKKIKGFDESSRYLEQDTDGNVWMGHGGKGIYRLTLNEAADSLIDLRHFTTQHRLPLLTGNILFAYKNEVYVSTNNGIAKFDKSSESFVIAEEINTLFNKSGKIKTLVTDAKGDVWFIAENESGVVRQNEDLTQTKITAPFRKLNNMYVKEFEYIYPYNNENALIGIEEGFAHYSVKVPKSYSHIFKSFITKVELPYIDSVLYLRSSASMLEMELPYRKNTLRFHFAAPFFENEIPMQFSFFLEGFSEDWSEWTTDTYKDFNTLHEGDYLLKLKAKNIYGVESEISTFQFVISPPWHRSTLAYIVYIVFILLLSFLVAKIILHRIRQSRLQEQQRHMQEIKKQEEQFQHQALIAENEIIDLRNEKLQTEMVHRNKELANQTMGIIRKNKFLIKINEDLKGIKEFIQNDTAKNKVASLKRRIAKEVDIKQQNKIFETYFDEVHETFFKRLKEKHPNLSPNDLRLCAFIRMNLTTQEIATILNISYRGAEISRYRLRKKLELSRGISLSTFLINI